VKLLFWLSLFLIVYAYFAYPCLLYFRARLRPRPIRKNPIFPTISFVIAAWNEAQSLARKLSNLRELDYPGEMTETIVVSDGSTDETNAILEKAAGVRAILLSVHGGKAEALNRAVEAATGEIIVFMDARQRLATDSIKLLVEGFADPAVGCVSGALELWYRERNAPRGVGSYWRMEKSIRNWESVSGSVVGATGALYAVRRSLVSKIPAGTILDDVFVPMEVVRQGARVTFEPSAIVWDCLPSNARREFRRKVRTLFGNYQLLRVAPWLLTRRNPLRFEFVSHKLFRLAVPFALIAMIVSSALLSGLVYRMPLVGAIGIASLGALAYARVPLGFVSRVTDLALAFVLLNTAAIVAVFYFLLGKKKVWAP
jgi:cellulose synthase/poly-beta-1,6-N-acetylglucosamine synthase-like glycosyltransferase